MQDSWVFIDITADKIVDRQDIDFEGGRSIDERQREEANSIHMRDVYAKSSSTSSTKHQPQSSPGSMDFMIGCFTE
jgi:hypothetical protein